MFNDWLDSEEFYKVCQAYRWAELPIKGTPQTPTAAEKFEELKAFIRDKIEDERSEWLDGYRYDIDRLTD